MIDDEHLVIYYTTILDDIKEYDIEDLKTFIKFLVLRLRKKYHLDLKGYYHLDVHIKKILILEFQKIDDYENEIDLNIVIHPSTPILLEFDDYFLIPGKKYSYQGKYYIPMEDIEFEKYIEFTNIVYGKEAELILIKGNGIE